VVYNEGESRVQPVTNEALNRTRRESSQQLLLVRCNYNDDTNCSSSSESLQLVDDDVGVTNTSETAERLMMTEKLIKELNETWEEKIRKSEEIRRQRFNTLFM